MPFVTIFACIAAAPVTALIAMALFGLASPWAAAAAIAVTIVPAAAFSLLWARDLDVLTASVRQIEADDLGRAPAETAGPTLMEPLALEIARLSRHLAARAALIEQERRADTLILERLPDALIVLRRDRTVSRAQSRGRGDLRGRSAGGAAASRIARRSRSGDRRTAKRKAPI